MRSASRVSSQFPLSLHDIARPDTIRKTVHLLPLLAILKENSMKNLIGILLFASACDLNVAFSHEDLSDRIVELCGHAPKAVGYTTTFTTQHDLEIAVMSRRDYLVLHGEREAYLNWSWCVSNIR
jgi:hypothetical protein